MTVYLPADQSTRFVSHGKNKGVLVSSGGWRVSSSSGNREFNQHIDMGIETCSLQNITGKRKYQASLN